MFPNILSFTSVPVTAKHMILRYPPNITLKVSNVLMLPSPTRWHWIRDLCFDMTQKYELYVRIWTTLQKTKATIQTLSHIKRNKKKYTYSYAKQNRTEGMRYKVQKCRGGGGGGHVNPTTSTAYLLLKAYLKAFKISLTNRSILQGALHANTRITQKQQTQIYSRTHTRMDKHACIHIRP